MGLPEVPVLELPVLLLELELPTVLLPLLLLEFVALPFIEYPAASAISLMRVARLPLSGCVENIWATMPCVLELPFRAMSTFNALYMAKGSTPLEMQNWNEASSASYSCLRE